MTSPYRHPYSWWLERLDGQQKVHDGIKALCPAHDDVGQSLHVTDKSPKLPLVHCFAGCAYSDIERAAKDTAEHPAPRQPRKRASQPIVVPSDWKGRPLEWFSQVVFGGKIPVSFIEALGAKGVGDEIHLTFPHNGIAKVRKIADKKYTWNKSGAYTPPLWPMPEDTLEETIYLTEGETDGICARFLGLPAYAITHGANASLPFAVWRTLRQRGAAHVVLMFDQDEAGEKAIRQYTDDAIEAGFTVSTIKPPLHVFEGEKDLRDWFLRTGGEEALTEDNEQAAIDLETLIKTVPHAIGWIARGLVARDAVTLVAGPPKAGKTSLVFSFLSAHEQGIDFLGEATTTGKALLMTEEYPGTLLEKFERFNVEKVAVMLQGDAARRGWEFPDALTRAVMQCKAEGRDTLVIDTLSAWAQFKDENDASEITRVMALLRNTAAGSGLAIVLIHHLRKGGGEYGEGVRGSSALFAQADILLEYIYKDTTTREVKVLSRYMDPPEPYYVRMTDGRLEVLDRATWSIEEAASVIETLRDGPASIKELVEKVDLSEPSILRHLRELVSIGRVEVEIGLRGKKTYTLTDTLPTYTAHIRPRKKAADQEVST